MTAGSEIVGVINEKLYAERDEDISVCSQKVVVHVSSQMRQRSRLATKLIMNETTIREHTCVVTIHSPNLKNNAPSYVFSGLCNESCYSSHVKIYFSFDFDLNAPILKIRSVVITIATSKFRVLPAIAFKNLT